MGSTLTLLDVTGIQGFIFGSNRLAENVGGSYLVKQALGDWLKAIAGDRVAFTGGGNALVRSSSMAEATGLVTRLHLKLIECAPGLGLVCAHREESASESFLQTYEELHKQLAVAKSERQADVAFDGAGVVAFAPPGDSLAVEYDASDNRWLSESSRARTDFKVARAATEELRGVIELEGDWDWSNELGRLGRTRGERSLLGVIHFDGNALGQRFVKASSSPESLRALSEAVNSAGLETLRRTLEWIKEHLDGLSDELDYRSYFPVRPILYGGDDITIVCEGRIALDLAARLLKDWREVTQVLPEGGQAEACAGVALVPVNYPFYRAYRLAEGCCKDAKRFLHDGGLERCSAIEWELSSGGAEQGRRQEDSLTCKPYLIGQHREPARDWNWFRHDLVNYWKVGLEGKHTQLKSLAEILRSGRERNERSEVREQLQRWKDKFQLKLPEPVGVNSVDGFFGDHTPYLDALEVLDRVNTALVREAVVS